VEIDSVPTNDVKEPSTIIIVIGGTILVLAILSLLYNNILISNPFFF